MIWRIAMRAAFGNGQKVRIWVRILVLIQSMKRR